MKSITLTEPLYDYLLRASLRETEVQRRLREETAGRRGAEMQIPPEQGQFMALLAELIGARRCIELGVYTGYSALAVALVLPPEGRLIACDISPEHTEIARRYWREAGVAERIELRLGPASETLAQLIDEGRAGSFDMAFIDADKTAYGDYYEALLTLVRPRGLIIADNVLWNGAVADPARDDDNTRALRAFNDRLRDDERVSISLLPVADGLMLAMKRS